MAVGVINAVSFGGRRCAFTPYAGYAGKKTAAKSLLILAGYAPAVSSRLANRPEKRALKHVQLRISG